MVSWLAVRQYGSVTVGSKAVMASQDPRVLVGSMTVRQCDGWQYGSVTVGSMAV